MPEPFDWKPIEPSETEKEWLESMRTHYQGLNDVPLMPQKTPLIQNYGRPGPLWRTSGDPCVNDLRFTPEAIASSIKQLREQEDVQITEIKDEANAVKIMGKLRSGDTWHEGLILCMHKAKPAFKLDETDRSN